MVKGRVVQILEIVEDDGSITIGLGMANKQGSITHGRLICEHADGDVTRLRFEPDAELQVQDGQAARHARGYAPGTEIGDAIEGAGDAKQEHRRRRGDKKHGRRR